MTRFEPDESKGRKKSIRRAVTVLLVVLASLSALDLVLDSPRVWSTGHAAVELALIAISVLAAALLGRGWHDAEDSLSCARVLADARRIERDAWRQRAQGAILGFGEAIDSQFDVWGLTPTEKETALLLLKGHSHKDAATHMGRSERTVRQHAVSVYRKSGLSGRAQLAAFFFDGMILPLPNTPPAM